MILAILLIWAIGLPFAAIVAGFLARRWKLKNCKEELFWGVILWPIVLVLLIAGMLFGLGHLLGGFRQKADG